MPNSRLWFRLTRMSTSLLRNVQADESREANKIYATMTDGIHTYACLNPTILQFSQAVVNISSRVSQVST
jgi:hypothetical protein